VTSYETALRRAAKFGALFARDLRDRRSKPTSHVHLDEIAIVIAGRNLWSRRADDDGGEVRDLLVRGRREDGAAVSAGGGAAVQYARHN
jgi:putative transposase